MAARPATRSRTRAALALLLSATLVALTAPYAGASAGPSANAPTVAPTVDGPQGAATASGFLFYKLPTPQPACVGLGFNQAGPSGPNYSRDDCGFVVFTLSESVAAAQVKAELYGPDGAKFATLPTTLRDAAAKEYRVALRPDATWAAGEIRMLIVANGEPAGEASFGHNLLGASIAPAPGSYQPGDPIPVTGEIYELDSTGIASTQTGVAAKFDLKLVDPEGGQTQVENITAETDGTFSTTIPGSATADITAGPETNYEITLGIAAVDATYTDDVTGPWAAKRAGSGAVTLKSPPTELILENSFVSAVGWVKPGTTYPSRVFVRNLTDRAFDNVQVVVTAADGSTFTQTSAGSISADKTTITWNVGNVAPDTFKTLVIESQADSVADDPEIVWKNLSSTAKMTYGTTTSIERSHGPKVIPQSELYDTARYGDRPFPVVPVDYLDRKHLASNSGDELAGKINSKDVPGSTFNLYQEISVGQLFPNGTVPSSGIASRGFDYEPGFDFTNAEPAGTCHGATTEDSPVNVRGTPLYPERIRDGFYQLPGNTDYYGDDKTGSALVGALAGVGPLFDIDSACGPTGKLVYDSAQIADPEIDYSDYDTDKDGVVDFFMTVYAGCGGHGASQTGCGGDYTDAPYDNVWPHSSSLEFYYTDEETGLTGYISDDQLKNLKGQKLYYKTESRSQGVWDTAVTEWPVYVRVGPYNVNPEDSIDHASVISHEYGHSLGLPDFYSLGGRETYGDWNLMATDKSQNMDIFSRQELGWVVPEVLEPGTAPTVEGWKDSKQDTNTLHWQTKGGTPYTLTGNNVDNAQAYVAKLPGRQLIDPAKFDTGDKATKSHAWWSGSGNDFGCAPEKGRNLDVVIPGLGDLPAGTKVKLEFKSLWDIEWDYDYGFVLTSINGGEEYTSHASEKSYTTPASTNPNANACQAKYGNGITGSSGSYEGNGSAQTDRLLSDYPPSVFLADSYDISDLAGVDNGVLRFSYATDPGLARPGWFIDDIKVTATVDGRPEVLLDTDLEGEGGPDDPSFFPGGCKDDTSVASNCTVGWNYISSSAGAPADHAYYMELRDRSGFDESGKGENDRDAIDFAAGLSLVYT
ncbi:MAG: immune inhibitor A domain-containing protein, partial [Nocardioides sp.]